VIEVGEELEDVGVLEFGLEPVVVEEKVFKGGGFACFL
jgi:hypothetical protein